MTSDQIKSQVFGLSLALATAIGCLAYERLVKSLPYTSVCFFVWFEYFWIWMLLLLFGKDGGIPQTSYWKENKWTILVFLLSGITSPLWYIITRKQNVMVGAIYEIKYIVVLAIIYLFFGSSNLSWNTVVGIILAMFSIYFISK